MLTLMSLAFVAAAEPPKPLVDYPHPLITEVLYSVPTGDAGDASGDGSRETNGDEFVEVVNPHERSIHLRGYVISAKSGDDPKRKYKTLRFVFPDITLQPGEVAVVFNGYKQTFKGPVGDTAKVPSGSNENFSSARVFTMNVDSARMGFSNSGDYVLLSAPGGAPIQCIKWGEVKAPQNLKLIEEAPEATKSSIARRTVDGALEPHPPIDGKRFSPGKFPFDTAPITPEAPKKEASPGDKSAPKRSR